MVSISLSPPISQQKVDILSPQAQAFLSKIEEKNLLRSALREKTGLKPPPIWKHADPASSSDRESGATRGKGGLLVHNAINDPKPLPGALPPWCYIPTAPATWYQVYHKDVYVCRSAPSVPPPDVTKGTRAEIFEFSDKSRANLRHVCNNSGHLIKSQFGLTYHEQWPVDGREVKRHLHTWLKSLRRLYSGIAYLWVLEFQKRGAPHFHVYLSEPPDREKQVKLADAWMKITGGTDTQVQFHAHPGNWIKWAMNDASYVMKAYACKKDQKEVPEQFHNVGRFWGHSRNMQPVGMIVEPSAVCRFAAPGVAQWDEQGLSRFIDRTLRRYHEKCMNYDRKTGQRRNRKWKKSPLIRGRSEIPGAFCVPFAAPLVVQIMNYVAENGPDPGTFRRWLNEKPPF